MHEDGHSQDPRERPRAERKMCRHFAWESVSEQEPATAGNLNSNRLLKFLVMIGSFFILHGLFFITYFEVIILNSFKFSSHIFLINCCFQYYELFLFYFRHAIALSAALPMLAQL